ncbi:necrosis inducing protein-domain-containing protein [Biscogniauxia marginata]|nr:necrosis inducing protein-domain-containing protein [Biscogniauxia marginata]
MLLQHRLTSFMLALLLPLAISTPVSITGPASHIVAARDHTKALQERATANDKKWQPALDFDTDSCYNVPAVDADGNVAKGLGNDYSNSASEQCRDAEDLDNNNVYSRQRCNNKWCAYMYDYYFEKDVAVPKVIDPSGHRHEWEHIVVFVQGDEAKYVAVSQHGKYETKAADKVRWDGTHPKVVYNKDGGRTHNFRFANEKDDKIENHKGVWFRGALVSYMGFPSTAVRDALMNNDWGHASVGIKDSSFKGNLDKARGKNLPEFDSGVDRDGSPGNP